MDLLFVGWDAATKSHVEQFDLPFWDGLSHTGRLLPEHPFDDAGYISSANAWTTISTGASFFDHGILGFVYGQYEGHPLAGPIQTMATQSFVPPLARRILIDRILGRIGAGQKGEMGKKIDSTDINYRRVWEYLDGEALIFGLPLTYPTWDTNGTLVSGIPAPKPSEASHPVVFPSNLEDLVYDSDDVGYYVDLKSPVYEDGVEERPYTEAHQERMKANTEKYIELYQNADEDPEFGFLMLRGLDDIMHATTDMDLIRESYKLIDKLTRDLQDAIDPEATIVLSDHGMREASRFRFDKDMRMDHDTTEGVWGGTEPFDIERHPDVTPAMLDYLDIEFSEPERRDDVTPVTSEEDKQAIHEHLEDLGYA